MSKFGIAFVDQPQEPLQGTYVKQAEDRGFASAWAVETRLMRDGLVPLSAWASRTERITLGTAMLNPFTRTPTLMAQSFATLDEISNNRSVFGIGAANQMLIEEFHGVSWNLPLTKTKETIEAFREIMTGEVVNYHGDTIDIEGAQLDFTPPRESIPIYMGVTGPRMLKLAGKMADGVILNTFTSEGYTQNALDLIEEGAHEANRDVPEIGSVPTFAISSDGDAAKEIVKPMLAEYVCNLPGLEEARRNVGDPFLEREDVTEEVMKPVRAAIEEEGIEAAAEHVPNWVVDEIAIAGSRDTCLSRLEEYLDSFGLDFVVPTFVGGNVGYGIDTIADYFELDKYSQTRMRA